MCEELRLERYDLSPWGFRLTGGLDFGTPLTVIKVTGGSVAELGGVKVGDLVIDINGKSAKNMTHTDAQQCIATAKNRLSLNIMRGSLVTPPDVTPLRGMTPMIDAENRGSKNQLNAEALKEQLTQIADAQNSEDGFKEAPQTREAVGMSASISRSVLSSRCEEKKETPQIVDPNVSDVELAELLTGNEEVLDQGILGINFQKFIPQVDFIRQSEVFKFLQNENTFKEIPEEVQLKKEPEKRFSTFLMKPKPPPPKPTGPLWHYPKAPNYLPRKKDGDKEEPKRRPHQSPPPKPPKEEEGHTVLWLFLGETGEQVIDERWGSEYEERENMSRNTNREDDEISISSSCKYCGKECNCRPESRMSEIREKIEKTKIEEEAEDVLTDEESVRAESRAKVDVKADVSESEEGEAIVSTQFSKQLADIQAQIAELDEQAPSELQTQLLLVQEQLANIAKMQMRTSKKIQETTTVETSFEETKMEERSEHYEYEERNEIKEETHEEKYECKEEREEREEREEESLEQEIETEETRINEEEEVEESDNAIHAFKKGEYEMCEAEGPKRKILPITPQMRPIVLPGGRMWRQPKDAAHEEFYQGILVAQADVLVGTAEGVNFTKYVPPKFDMSHSAVYRLIHEIEDRSKDNLEKEKMERECYNAPLSKRQLYLATLPQPPPIGEVELKDL